MFNYNDGGRAGAGFKGKAGDCVVRAIAIATGEPYALVYESLNNMIKSARQTKSARRSASRNGVNRRFYEAYLKERGWRFIATMQIGSGCKTHLRPEELPSGMIIARVSKHLVAVFEGVAQDTYDCTREGTRCVYGYYEHD